MNEIENTDPNALLAWIQTGHCERAYSGETEENIESDTQGDQLMVQSETFQIHLPLKGLSGTTAAPALSDDARFERFRDFRNPFPTFIVDRSFAKIYEQVEAAVIKGESQRIVVDGLQDRLFDWINVVMQLLAGKMPKRHVFFIQPCSFTKPARDDRDFRVWVAHSGTMLSGFCYWSFTTCKVL